MYDILNKKEVDRMLITKFKKSKNNTYEVLIDDIPLILYDDVIIKYELLIKKEINKELYCQMIRENQSLECYYEALKYLNKKRRCEKEVKDFLEKKEFSYEQIDKTIKRLKQENYLNALEYVEAFVNDKINLTMDGPNKIKMKLQQLKIAKDIIDEEIKKVPVAVWQEKSSKLVTKKAKQFSKDSKQMIIWKIKNYLLNEGYDQDTINKSLASVEIKTDELKINQEYEKIKNKLSQKYSGEALNWQIKMKMYQKGYTSEEIEYVLKKITNKFL